uniref:Uncharacterized protein n=1 Tax=Echinococcus canadensis TaxID=519352 RepID=A0A915EVX0_9CEST
MEKPIKILFVGDSAVGKTSIMKRFADQKFDESITPTIGVDFTPSKIEVDGQVYTLSFWDTAGAEANGMTALQPLFYRNAEGVLLGMCASFVLTISHFYDVTRRESFDDIKSWDENVEYYTNNPNVVKMLVGNKIDLVAKVALVLRSLLLSDRLTLKGIEKLTRLMVDSPSGVLNSRHPLQEAFVPDAEIFKFSVFNFFSSLLLFEIMTSIPSSWICWMTPYCSENQEFNDLVMSTLGVDFMSSKTTVDACVYARTFWVGDTAGAEANGMTALQPLFYRNAEGVLLGMCASFVLTISHFYDVTRRESFDDIKSWDENVEYYTNNPNVVKMLVGNKIDLVAKVALVDRAVRKEEARDFALRSSMLFVETSALTSENINNCFDQLVSSAADQAEVTRLSWSPDGSVIAAPHAVNNNFPTAQLITRNRWQTGLDLRYNPNLLKKAGGNESPGMVCLALGGKDRSSSGCELLASSLDGSISYMSFTKEELGEPIKLEDVARLHRKLFGQSLIDGLLNALRPSPAPLCNGVDSNAGQKAGGNVVLETPEALTLQRSQSDLRQRL